MNGRLQLGDGLVDFAAGGLLQTSNVCHGGRVAVLGIDSAQNLVDSVRGKLIIAVGAVVGAYASTHGELHNGATRLADVFVGMCPGRINACRSGMGFTGAIADSG